MSVADVVALVDEDPEALMQFHCVALNIIDVFSDLYLLNRHR